MVGVTRVSPTLRPRPLILVATVHTHQSVSESVSSVDCFGPTLRSCLLAQVPTGVPDCVHRVPRPSVSGSLGPSVTPRRSPCPHSGRHLRRSPAPERHRCRGHLGGSGCVPRGRRSRDPGRLIRFAKSSWSRTLRAPTPSKGTTNFPSRCETPTSLWRDLEVSDRRFLPCYWVVGSPKLLVQWFYK